MKRALKQYQRSFLEFLLRASARFRHGASDEQHHAYKEKCRTNQHRVQ
jgi:hypothetical protein